MQIRWPNIIGKVKVIHDLSGPRPSIVSYSDLAGPKCKISGTRMEFVPTRSLNK